jgi:signal transduction histidine kinase
MKTEDAVVKVRIRTWPVLAFGFGSLLLLTLLFGIDSWRRAGRIYASMAAFHRAHSEADQALQKIESGIYLSSILVRDFLLDYSQITAGFQRQQLLAMRSSMDTQLKQLNDSTAIADRQVLDRLRRENNAYWESLEPLFGWTPSQRVARSYYFLRRQVLPRRAGVLDLAAEARALNAAGLAQRQRESDLRMRQFQKAAKGSLAMVLGLALIVALASIYRVSKLETEATRQLVESERAEKEMRSLSRQLMRAQEDERRNLSRELHDEIGQTLTALTVELANIQKLRLSPEEHQRHIDEARGLTAQTMRSVRQMAAGLRPSVLDDLGLGPALEWQAREFSRRTGIPVEVSLEGLRPDLPETHRTCLYRVVQETLTNCARHADARHIRINVHSDGEKLALTVQDDGKGFVAGAAGRPAPANGSRGIGLTGIEDRVKELGGSVAIQSQPGKGALVEVALPLPEETAA